MKTRIALSIALIAALAVSVLNLSQLREKITRLQTNLREQTSAREKAERELASTISELKETKDGLREVETELATVKTLSRDLASKIETQAKSLKVANGKLAALQQKYDDTSAELSAYKSVMTLQQAVSASKQIKDLILELDVTKAEKKLVSTRFAQFRAKYDFGCGGVLLPADLEGKVLVLDPKWQFVILDAGEDQGVLENCELFVSRSDKFVGKVVIRRVEKNRSIANIVPGWNLAEIREGDRVTPALLPGS